MIGQVLGKGGVGLHNGLHILGVIRDRDAIPVLDLTNQTRVFISRDTAIGIRFDIMAPEYKIKCSLTKITHSYQSGQVCESTN